MHPIHVSVISPEEASHGVAELWAGGALVAFTRLEDGDLMVHVQPGPDGAPVALGAHSLVTALLQARELLKRA